MERLFRLATSLWQTPTPSCINAGNPDRNVPLTSDIVVAGGSIHALIYAIHTRKRSLARAAACPGSEIPSITVFEKLDSPGYKIGESTLTVFGLWLKTVGIDSALLWRLFGPKDGLAFYYLRSDNADQLGKFSANGPPGDFVPTLQIERKVSELLLAMYAQRLGINVYHGHEVKVDETELPADGSDEPVCMSVSNGRQNFTASASLLVDATGRFRRITSRGSRKESLEGFNTEAYWAYFDFDASDEDIDLPSYETCNTNHICIPEGWAWVIRLPSWEGSPLSGLIAMINFLLDLNAKNAHPDEYPSSEELAKTFKLKFRWVVSIGYALRDDVQYPEDLSKYGSCDAERKFNWITGRYARMKQLMRQHRLIQNLYGPHTTWFVRKGLSYRSPVVCGHRWAAVGDATGFTNPLYSPGINCNMAAGIKLAELTHSYLTCSTKRDQSDVMDQYQQFCAHRIPNLHRMNRLNYLLMRSHEIGPLGPLWQYLVGTGNSEWQSMRSCTFDDVAEVLTTWDWGANRPEFIEFANKTIMLLDGPPVPPCSEIVTKVQELSAKMVETALSSGKYVNRWAGLLRWYDDQLKYCPDKSERDVLAKRCEACRNWRILRDDVKRCATCGAVNMQNSIVRYMC